MEVEPQIAFHGFEPSPSLRALIEHRISLLERYHPHVITCRVAVEMPHRRHRKGNVWHVKVNVSIPGRDIAIQREAEIGRRHEVPEAAVRDAFDAARRRLQERARRMQGSVKVHEGQPDAIVEALGPDHGFLTTPDGRSMYFHEHSLLDAKLDDLSPGARVSYVEEDGIEGPQASTVRLRSAPEPKAPVDAITARDLRSTRPADRRQRRRRA
jgi:ribosome-associated translation inhibitor RaiA/cold shock CspA family protein